ncbi:MAG: 16S rRNA (cytidine(1402)-2'-O)-methyltransferase [Pseudomonadota bacterium]
MSAKNESKRTSMINAGTVGDGVAHQPLESGLWLVATPIGNLGDITLRAISVLRDADVLVCEDTRRTRRLLDLLDIPLRGRRVISYHDRNGADRRPEVLAELEKGGSVAYASDAGTPLIADPGFRLVTDAKAEGYAVHTAPGPSSVIAALTVAGLPTDRFLFAGFLPPKTSARRRALEDLKDLKSTLVFFESPRRLAAALIDFAEVLGAARPAAIVRELTKTFEDVRQDTLKALADYYQDGDVKGEIVLVVGPPPKLAHPVKDDAELDRYLATALQTLSVKDAAREVATRLGLSRRDVYARALALGSEPD